MRKLFLIGLKDLKLAFRDRAALILMLLAPFLLTLGLGFVTGRFSAAPRTASVISRWFWSTRMANNSATAWWICSNPKTWPNLSPQPSRMILLQPKNWWMITRPWRSSLSRPGLLTAFPQFGISEWQIAAINPFRSNCIPIRPRPPVSASSKTILDRVHQPGGGGRVGGRGDGHPTRRQRPHPGPAGPGSWYGEPVIDQANAAGQNTAITAQQRHPQRGSRQVRCAGPAGSWHGTDVPDVHRQLWRAHDPDRAQPGHPAAFAGLADHCIQILGGKMIGIFLTGAAQMLILILGTTALFQLQWGDPLARSGAGAGGRVSAAVGWGMLLPPLPKPPAR